MEEKKKLASCRPSSLDTTTKEIRILWTESDIGGQVKRNMRNNKNKTWKSNGNAIDIIFMYLSIYFSFGAQPVSQPTNQIIIISPRNLSETYSPNLKWVALWIFWFSWYEKKQN